MKYGSSQCCRFSPFSIIFKFQLKPTLHAHKEQVFSFQVEVLLQKFQAQREYMTAPCTTLLASYHVLSLYSCSSEIFVVLWTFFLEKYVCPIEADKVDNN